MITVGGHTHKIICIYKITSPSGRIYIGQTVDFYKRESKYKNANCKAQTKLYSSILKYGWCNHKIEILCRCDKKQLNELEKKYVDLYKSTDKYAGLNLKDGGIGNGGHSEETKRKISQSKTGKKMKPFSEKHINNLKEARKRQVITKQHRESIRLVRLGTKLSEETKQKIRNALKGNQNAKKQIK